MRNSGLVIGTLSTLPAREHPELLAAPVVTALETFPEPAVLVAEIDPALADTAAFCERYAVPLEQSANCVVVAGRRGGPHHVAACVVLATTRADVNGVVRRRLDARRHPSRRWSWPWPRPAWSTAASRRSACLPAGRST